MNVMLMDKRETSVFCFYSGAVKTNFQVSFRKPLFLSLNLPERSDEVVTFRLHHSLPGEGGSLRSSAPHRGNCSCNW